MSNTTDETLDSDLEPIERRGKLRGYVYGVEVDLGDAGVRPVVEGSPRGMFVSVDDPETFQLRSVHSVVVSHGDTKFRCKVEVVRKEVEPRTGIALQIVQATQDADFDWKRILADAEKIIGEPEPE